MIILRIYYRFYIDLPYVGNCPDQFNQHKGCQSITVEYFYCMYLLFLHAISHGALLNLSKEKSCVACGPLGCRLCPGMACHLSLQTSVQLQTTRILFLVIFSNISCFVLLSILLKISYFVRRHSGCAVFCHLFLPGDKFVSHIPAFKL